MDDLWIKDVVVVSCLDPYYDFNWLFGDWIDFDASGQGLYQNNNEFANFFLALQRLLDIKKEVYLIFPQPYTGNPRWEKDYCFNYIELPEFYGIYAKWFETYYSNVDTTPAFDKQFMCLNKRNRVGRQALFCLMLDDNILDRGYVSFLGHDMGLRTEFSTALWKLNHEAIVARSGVNKDLSDRALAMMPYQPHDLTQITDDFCATGGWLPDSDLYKKSFVTVVGETHETLNGQSIFTEKTFRAMWFDRPFFILGSSGALIQLKKMGFETFDQWFDESYDLEKSLFSRCQMISSELTRISQWNLDYCSEVWHQMKPVLEHNKNHLKKLSSRLDRRLTQIDSFIDVKAQNLYRRRQNSLPNS